MNVIDLRAEAAEQWEATPPDEYVDDDGIRHRGRASQFRKQFVEPYATRIADDERAGRIDRETARQLYDACLSPIPVRRALLRRIDRGAARMWEFTTQRRLWAEHGVMTRTLRQMDSDNPAIRDLPWVAHVAGEYGIVVPSAFFEVSDISEFSDEYGEVVDDDEAEAMEIIAEPDNYDDVETDLL